MIDKGIATTGTLSRLASVTKWVVYDCNKRYICDYSRILSLPKAVDARKQAQNHIYELKDFDQSERAFPQMSFFFFSMPLDLRPPQNLANFICIIICKKVSFSTHI